MTIRNLVLGGPYSPRDTPNWLVRCMRAIERWANKVATSVTALEDAVDGFMVMDADLTLYVRADGDDENDGTADSATGAFLTHGRAMEEAGRIHRNGFELTIQSRLATSTEPVVLPPNIGPGYSRFIGDTTTPANCLINVTGRNAIQAGSVPWDNPDSVTDGPAHWYVAGFEVRTASPEHALVGDGIAAHPGGYISAEDMKFGTCARNHIYAQGGMAEIIGDYAISGGAAGHRTCDVRGMIFGPFSSTVTITNTPAFSVAFVVAFLGGVTEESTVTYSGSATGKRFSAIGGHIYTYSTSETYHPGDSAGTVTESGSYSGTFGTRGIRFNGDTATANILDDYEEGTWSPAITGSSSNPTLTYASQVGTYTKIGNLVNFSLLLVTATYSGGSGDLRISLPFTNGAANNHVFTAYASSLSWTASKTALVGIANPSEAFLLLRGLENNAAVGTVQTGDYVNGDVILISGAFTV
jgi:hypothetical protein